MNVAADAQREDSVNTLIRQGEVQAKIHDKDFDVFLSYNSGDRSQVRKIYNELKYRGVAPWFDDEEVPPGRPWLRLLEEQIENIKTAAVFIGNSGIGPWHQQEMEALLREFVNRKCPVIPVFLASAPEDANFPIFLRGMTEVDFRKPRLIQDHNADEEQGYKFEYPVDTIVDSNLEPIDRLVWGITGNRSTLQGERKMTLTPKTTRPIEIFISYARKDQRLRDQLETHLSSLKREGLISTWYDRKIGGGEEWAGKINEHLTMAHIILLLVSPDFIASEYCNDVEVKRALERYAAGDAHVIPVILRRVDWESTPLGKLQALPRDAKPVTSWTNRDDAFFDVAQGIRRVVKGQIATPLHMHDLASTQLSIRGFRPPINPRTIQQRKKVVHEVYAKLIRPDITAIVLTGIGGAGKSVLAALVSDYAEKRQNAGGSIFHDKPLWLRIDNGFKMADLVRTTLESLGKPISNIGNQTPLNQAVALFDALDRLEKPRLVVFDQFENLLDWQTGQSLTDQPGVGEWLDVINSQKCTCRILLTSRPWPEGNQVYSRTYMQEYPIKGLESMEGIELLQKQGVKGTDAELREAVRRCEGHALALTLLASLLRGDPSLSIGRLLDDNDPFYAQLWSGEIADKLLDMIYKGQLDEAQRKLLQAFSVYREPVALEAALAIIAEVSRAKLMKARRVLLTQHLLQAIGEGEGRYQLHAIVAEYAQAHFDENNEEANKEALRSAHAKAAQYYQKQAEIFCPPPEKRRSVSDVQSLIEMVWQLCQAEEWQQVYALMEREDLFMHLKRCGSNAILLELYQLLLPLEKWQPESLQKARIYSDLGDIYKAFGRIPQALENLEQALDIYKEKRDRRENWVLNNLGRVYSMRGQIEQAKQYFEEALVISRQKGDRGYSEDEITTLNELAEVYIAVGQKDKSLEYSEQALSISKEIKDSGKEATTFKNLGIVYSTVGKKEQAKRYYEEALKIQRERGIRGEEGKTLNSLGELYNDLGQKEEALKNFDQALSKRKEVGDRLGEGKTLWNIGVLFLEKAHYHVALACFLLARKIFEEIQSPHRDEVQKRMDDLRGNVGDEQYSIMLKKVASRAPQIVEQALLLGL